MPESLKLQVSADLSQAEASLNKFVKTAGKSGQEAATALSGGLNKAEAASTKTFSKMSANAKAAIKPVSQLGDSIETLRAKLLARQNFLITEKDIGKIAVYNSEIKQLQAEIVRLQTVGTSSLGAVGSAGTKAFSFLRTAALVLPGIGIAGIFGAAFSGIESIFSGTSAKADELQKKLKELIKPVEDIASAAGAGSQEELSKVSALSKAVLDQTLSYKQRNNALNQLKDINKSYFGDLTVETAALGLLKDRVDEYTKALINAAVIKAFQDEIGKIAVELSKQEKAFNEAGKAVTDARTKLQKLNGEDFFFQNIKLGDVVADFKDQSKVVGKLRGQMFDLRTSIDEAVRSSLEFRPLDDPKKVNADTENIIAKAKEMAAFLKEAFIIKYQFDPRDTKAESIRKAQSFLDDVSKGNLKVKIQFESLGNEPSPATPDIKGIPKFEPTELSFDFQSNAALINKFQAQLNAIGSKLTLPVIDMELPATFNEHVFDNFIKGAIAAQKVSKVLTEAIQNISIQGISSVAEGLGSALAGGDISKIFSNFGNIIASGLQAIGKQMIAMSPVIAALKVALKSLNPALLLPAGIALTAIGAALRQSLSGGIKGFAQGGLVFGPTVGLVGEGSGTSRSNPEVIAPLDKLRGMMAESGTGRPQLLFAKIRGNHILLSNERTTKQNRRT